jgi:hypothetical protein
METKANGKDLGIYIRAEEVIVLFLIDGVPVTDGIDLFIDLFLPLTRYKVLKS